MKTTCWWLLMGMLVLSRGDDAPLSPFQPETVGVIAGAHFEPLPKVMLYTSSVPLNFKVPWPLQLTEIHEGITLLSSCPSNASSDWCSVFRELKQVMFYSDMLLNKLNDAAGENLEYDSVVNREKRGLSFIGDFVRWCCDVAVTSQVDSLFLNQQQIALHIDQMEAQIIDDHVALANLSNSISVVNEAMTSVLKRVQTKFTNLTDYLRTFREAMTVRFSGMVKEIGHSFQLQLLLAAQLAKQAHTLTRIEVLDQCRSHKIPSVLITPALLQEKLQDLETILVKDGYKLAISSTQVQAYFHLPICRCNAFKESLYVSVKIPIVRYSSNWKLFQFVGIPFHWKNNTCHLEHEPNFLAVDGNHLVTIQGRNLLDCRPLEENLCFVPRFSGDTMGSALCPKALFQGVTIERLAELCTFQCRSGTHLMITQAGPERYFLTHLRGKVELQCAKNPNQTLIIDDEERPGAVDIEVPCDCRLYLNSELKINELYPCDYRAKSKFQLLHVIPAAWTRLKKLKIFPRTASSHTVFPSLEDCLDEDWPSAIPHLNFTVSRFTRLDPISLNKPVEVLSFMVRHVQSIALFVIGGTLFLIIIRNPYLVGIGTFPRVAALDETAMLNAELTVMVFILGIIIGMLAFLIWKCIQLKRSAQKNLKISSPVTPVEASTSGEAMDLRERLRNENVIKAKLSSNTGDEFLVNITLIEP
ncbi:uncharacterized protein LOC134527106 [Bacillus rossius redtenbacheri]|uniref:uncharacterized protein LOC134527106 n=1 Tax=Bacillus rossius redtenbacheri TaxID=93214 RepID=UPI002FDC91D9